MYARSRVSYTFREVRAIIPATLSWFATIVLQIFIFSTWGNIYILQYYKDVEKPISFFLLSIKRLHVCVCMCVLIDQNFNRLLEPYMVTKKIMYCLLVLLWIYYSIFYLLCFLVNSSCFMRLNKHVHAGEYFSYLSLLNH